MVEHIENLKKVALDNIDKNRDRIIKLSQDIFATPELAFEEFKTAELLTRAMKEMDGVEVKTGLVDLETSFWGAFKGQKKGPNVCILAEYDALPGIGHACGHNIIAASAVAALYGLTGIKDSIGGSLSIAGTPAEEGGGGKIIMLERGAFHSCDVILSLHPHNINAVGIASQGVRQLRFNFRGNSSHAATSPHLGKNALEAVISTFNNVNSLRQHVKEDVRIHGIITHGGIKPNIVPDFASCLFFVRSRDEKYLDQVEDKVKNCARAGAMGTGTEVEIKYEGFNYRAMKPNQVLVDLMEENMHSLGLEITEVPYIPASNDSGNLSWEIPSAKALVKIAGADIALHSKAFAQAASSPEGDEGLILGAKLLALTAIDLMVQPELMEMVNNEFSRKVLGS